MNAESIDFAPNFSFKPIDDDMEASSACPDESSSISPTDIIFRESVENDSHQDGTTTMFRANPVDSSRVISPFSHTASFEELQEREHFTATCSLDDWARTTTTRLEMEPIVVDFAKYFESSSSSSNNNNNIHTTIEVMDCCDDFSLSSCEPDDLAQDLCLEKIWEEGITTTTTTDHRASLSPTQVSLGSNDNRRRMMGMKQPRRQRA